MILLYNGHVVFLFSEVKGQASQDAVGQPLTECPLPSPLTMIKGI